jgi:hypothetical protein
LENDTATESWSLESIAAAQDVQRLQKDAFHTPESILNLKGAKVDKLSGPAFIYM